MRIFKRISALFLALLMMLGMLASCNSNTTTVTSAPDTTSSPDTTNTQEPSQGNIDASKEEKILPDLPDVRYDGYEYRIRCKGDTLYWPTLGIHAEQKTGEPINDATLERNNFIQEKYGVTISSIEGDDVKGAVTQAVLSQVDEFDIAIIPMTGIASVAPKYVYDFKQLSHIDVLPKTEKVIKRILNSEIKNI